MADSFRCKEENCGLTIEYVPRVISAVIGFQVRKTIERPSVVYLTCDNGHVHSYVVAAGGGGGGGV